jgi:hypothetical protein
MSLQADRQLLALALECASRLKFDATSAEGAITDVLGAADAILEWHERRLKGAASRDPLRKFEVTL